jgi:hypothetical protein
MAPGVFKSFLVIIVLFGASAFIWDYSARTNIRELQGHWHSSTDESITLDVIDTLVIVNHYSRTVPPDTFSIIDRELGRVVLPIRCGCGGGLFPEMSRFTVNADILTYDSITDGPCYGFDDMRFKRCDPAICHLEHAIQPHGVLNFYRLPVARETISMQLKSSLYSTVLIGFPSEEEYGAGPAIQVNDVFITAEQLPQYFNSEKQKGNYGPKLTLVWLIDADVPADFLANVFQNVPRDSSTHYQLVMSKDKKRIGYQLMDSL